jgi:hypothetical protein
MIDDPLSIARRHFFRECGYGLGKAALAALLVSEVRGADAPRSPSPFAPKKPHFPAKAKAVIHLFMAGAPSQLDLFDNKPALTKLEGKPLPPEVIQGQRYAFIRPEAGVLGPRFKFARHGRCGAEIASRVGGLMEDLKVYEVDPLANEAVLRSDAPRARGANLAYYEIRLHGLTRAVVRRFTAAKPKPGREQAPFALTHEVLARLVEDIAG